jgi:hypothetical protein
MPRPSRTLRLGDQAPPFELRDSRTGQLVSLERLLEGRRGVLLVFHRGMW